MLSNKHDFSDLQTSLHLSQVNLTKRCVLFPFYSLPSYLLGLRSSLWVECPSQYSFQAKVYISENHLLQEALPDYTDLPAPEA